MQAAVFSTKAYDRSALATANSRFGHDLRFFEPRLTASTIPLASGFPCICVFVNDVIDAETINKLADQGLGLIALRCAGFNNVDLTAAEEAGVKVVRVLVGQPLGHPHRAASGNHHLRRVPSAGEQRHRAVARLPAGGLRPDLHHLSCAFEAQDVGFARRRRIQAPPLEQVRAVDRSGDNPNPNRIGPQRRRRHLAESQL